MTFPRILIEAAFRFAPNANVDTTNVAFSTITTKRLKYLCKKFRRYSWWRRVTRHSKWYDCVFFVVSFICMAQGYYAQKRKDGPAGLAIGEVRYTTDKGVAHDEAVAIVIDPGDKTYRLVFFSTQYAALHGKLLVLELTDTEKESITDVRFF